MFGDVGYLNSGELRAVGSRWVSSWGKCEGVKPKAPASAFSVMEAGMGGNQEPNLRNGKVLQGHYYFRSFIFNLASQNFWVLLVENLSCIFYHPRPDKLHLYPISCFRILSFHKLGLPKMGKPASPTQPVRISHAALKCRV